MASAQELPVKLPRSVRRVTKPFERMKCQFPAVAMCVSPKAVSGIITTQVVSCVNNQSCFDGSKKHLVGAQLDVQRWHSRAIDCGFEAVGAKNRQVGKFPMGSITVVGMMRALGVMGIRERYGSPSLFNLWRCSG